MARVPLPALAGLTMGLGAGVAFCLSLQSGARNAPPPGAALVPPPPPAEQQLAAAAPDRLVGLTGATVRRAMGEPEMRRRDPPAEVWQYRTARCVLDLYFYGDPDADGVAHFEARPRDTRQTSAPAEACLGELLGRRRPVV